LLSHKIDAHPPPVGSTGLTDDWWYRVREQVRVVGSR